MKTLVVICSLVTIALAAPALQEEGIEDTNHAQDWDQSLPSNLEPVKREKKTPLNQSSHPQWHSDTPNTEVHIDSGVSSPMARSFGLTKPLIVKKKFGYRLYRDSDEEKANADSHESCGRQVKVKLCDEDGKFREMLRNTGHEVSEIHTSEDDMKSSIMMAKEAVENLQRDLKKMEQKSEVMKTAHGSETDVALHEDIEVARQALEHIHKNFGNMDTMNSQTTASRDSEDMHDFRVTVARLEEEKMAQWKEAMDNIQRNIEIARNIEDSFKVTDGQSLLHLDQSHSPSTKNEHRMEENVDSHVTLGKNHMRDVETTNLLTKTTAQANHEERLAHEPIIEHSSQHHIGQDQDIEEDMRPFASEPIEMKTVFIENHHTLRSDNQKLHEHGHEHTDVTHIHNKAMQNIEKTQEHTHLPKSSESELNVVRPSDATKQLQTLLRDTEVQSDAKLDPKKDALFKTSETVWDKSMVPLMAGINTEVLSEQQQRTTGVIDTVDKQESKSHLNLPRENEGSETIGNDAKSMQKENFMKAAHSLDSLRLQPKHSQIDYNESEEVTKLEMKSADDHILHPLTVLKSADDHILHPLTVLKSADDHMHHHNHHHHLTAMKATEDHLHHLESEPVHGHWAQESRHLHKAAEGIHGIDNKQHHLGPIKMRVTPDMSEHGRQHPHFPTRYHKNLKSHSQVHEMNNIPGSGLSPNFHTNMRDAMESLETEHTFRWKPSHESSRSAYGGSIGSIGSSGGAVGVFPTANTGGCGIPLLLSCSPSVVSGSLAKAHAAGPASYTASSYTAPSYRTEEDFSFHNKRDIKNTNEMRSTNILRTPAIVKQKTSTDLENNI